MSAEPQSREALENQSKSLLSLFDSHLKIIADRYLAFFQKRRRIEEEYINSLRTLHREANVVDSSFDPRAELTTTRAAWDILRDSLERESNTREAFVISLDTDVIKPLSALKASPELFVGETGDQTRKRIEENLRNSAAGYADHAENTISKLQQAYLKKYHPGDHSHSTIGLQHVSNRKFGVKDLFRGRRELDRVESEDSVLEDDCRKAVRILNIIRSTRAENLEDGYNCLEDLVFRTTVKGVLAKYLDDTIAANKIYHDLAMGTRPVVWKALNGKDGSGLAGSFHRAFSLSVPPLTLYRNYRSSGYSNLIFGVPLADPAADQYNVPKVIGMCIAEVEKRGLNTHKLYSLGSINDAEVLQLRRRMEGEFTFSFISSDSIHAVAMLLKLYLWDLPVPLLRLSLRDFRQYGQNKGEWATDRFMHVLMSRIAKYTENDFSLLRSVIRELPLVHRETLRELSRHLSLVASHSDQNGMTAKALASQFCYAVFRGHTIVEGYVYLKDSLMEDLIQNADALFDEHLSPHPPPPARAGSGTSTISYSSLFANSMFAAPEVFDPEGPASARSSSTIFPFISSMDFPIPPSMPSDLFLSPQNSHSLFDERPPSSPPVYSQYEAETASEVYIPLSRMGPPNTRSPSLPIDHAPPTVPIVPTGPTPVVPTVRTPPVVRILPIPPSSSPRPLALSHNSLPAMDD
ncbi:Rho GTPase activation protein [Lactarius vividus]|nr:Rho GTPase activation protein [Lactarius vividus]